MRVSVKDKVEVRMILLSFVCWVHGGSTCNVYTKDYTKCNSAPKTQWEKHKFTRVAERPEKMK
jgi:hypothetical protein